jgi:hypothetical protein
LWNTQPEQNSKKQKEAAFPSKRKREKTWEKSPIFIRLMFTIASLSFGISREN